MVNPRIAYKNNKWMLSFNLNNENQVIKLNDYSVGIDLGIKELAVVMYGNNYKVYHNINKSKRIKNLKKRMAHAQRSVWRKKEAAKTNGVYSKEHSKNEEKALDKYRKIHLKIANIRDDYIHKTTCEIVNLSPRRVVMEDLSVMNMLKNKSLSGAIFEENFSKFKTYMKYKCENRGIDFVLADKFFPSSKMCSACGCLKHTLSLKTRTYMCDECGLVIDRDLNAAKNLMNYVA